ncbi:origin recognition complex subunit 5 [Leptopilina boulardi]|uniref:origin recognition complex subunit 5 n=1 Tax=Leptopilina boulardi TaxID=63433 RepID=UPI0021F67EAC|nr:origin recognition complex subunit 5 [Leptopilina boulardi]
MEECVEALGKTIICRDNIIRRFYSLIAPNEPLPEFIFAYGHIASGKSLIIQSIVNHLKYKYSVINCVDHLTNKHMFEDILMDLTDINLKSEDNFKSPFKVDSLMDFILQLRFLFTNDDDPIIIIFDKCEYLRDKPILFRSLLRLRELSEMNVCPIFVTDLTWDKFFSIIKIKMSIKFYFPPYTQQETARILLFYKPKGCDETFYKNYLNLFLSVFYRFCRDLNELRYMASINFEKYIEPITDGKCTSDDNKSLWLNVVNVFKKNLEVIYLRVSSDDFVQNEQLSNEIGSITKLAQSFELPIYAKYILIASFLASYNPVKEDKYLFMKGTKKRRKRAHVSMKKQVLNTQTGPKTFPFQRMLSIFCCIVEEDVDINTKVISQVPTMCELGLLTPVGDSNIDEPKFKCCVSYDFAMVISKIINFPLKNYLYDFMHQ